MILDAFLYIFGSFCSCMSLANRFAYLYASFYRSIVFLFTLILERPFYLLLDLKKLFLSKLKSYICLIFDLLFSYSLFKVLLGYFVKYP